MFRSSTSAPRWIFGSRHFNTSNRKQKAANKTLMPRPQFGSGLSVMHLHLMCWTTESSDVWPPVIKTFSVCMESVLLNDAGGVLLVVKIVLSLNFKSSLPWKQNETDWLCDGSQDRAVQVYKHTQICWHPAAVSVTALCFNVSTGSVHLQPALH